MSDDGKNGEFAPVGEGDYIVAQGECLNSISEKHGFFWETLWNLPENRDLKSARKDPNVLWPGDRLTIPPLRLKDADGSTEQRHRFRHKGVPARLLLEFRHGDKPRANEDYLLVIDGRFRRGQTDGDGRISETIPNGAQSAKVVFESGSSREEYEVTLGGLDPFDSLSGVRARLANLGYSIPVREGEMDADTAQALRQFQQRQGVEPKGEMDPDTCSKLREAHGS